jgi:DNA-binding XRE family transcriptional regulator
VPSGAQFFFGVASPQLKPATVSQQESAKHRQFARCQETWVEYYALSDEDITSELGRRLQRLRQRRGYSKQMLADATGYSAKVITQLEDGDGSLAALVAVLRYLGAFDQIAHFLIEAPVNALEMRDARLPTAGTVMSRRSIQASN